MEPDEGSGFSQKQWETILSLLVCDLSFECFEEERDSLRVCYDCCLTALSESHRNDLFWLRALLLLPLPPPENEVRLAHSLSRMHGYRIRYRGRWVRQQVFASCSIRSDDRGPRRESNTNQEAIDRSRAQLGP